MHLQSMYEQLQIPKIRSWYVLAADEKHRVCEGYLEAHDGSTRYKKLDRLSGPLQLAILQGSPWDDQAGWGPL